MKLPREDYDDSRARRLYPDQGDGYFYGPSDYRPIIDSFGNVLVQVDDDDYQGDTRVLLEKDGRFGFLNFGWGSCSGCDGLLACASYREIEELIRGLEGDIKWFDTLQEAKDYIASPDRKTSYYYHKREWDRFVQKVAAYGVLDASAINGEATMCAEFDWSTWHRQLYDFAMKYATAPKEEEAAAHAELMALIYTGRAARLRNGTSSSETAK